MIRTNQPVISKSCPTVSERMTLERTERLSMLAIFFPFFLFLFAPTERSSDLARPAANRLDLFVGTD